MSQFREVRDDETGRLLFTFDAERDIIRVIDRHRGVDATVHLRDYREKSAQESDTEAGTDARKKK